MRLKILPALVAIIGGMTLVAPGPAIAASPSAVFTKKSDWGSGWEGEVAITNGGSSALSSWRVEFDLPSGTAVTTVWEADQTRTGQHFTFTNKSWNGTINPGGTVRFGFNGSGPGAPSGCLLNGASCAGGGTPPTDPPTDPPTNPPTDPPAGSTPVAINGQLHVCGRQLCNTRNKAIQLRGMSTHGLQWYANCITNASLDVLATEWNADVLRISMYIQEGGYETDPAGYTAKVNTIIDQATARGLYAIVDWHMLDPGDPNYNLARAKTFFGQIAARHKDKTNILYEIANEPSEVHWNSIKSYADQIIPVIRNQDPDGIVLVGTEDWSSLSASGDGQGVARILANPVRFDNVMYVFHFYAASHDDYYLDTFRNGIANLPMFVTEFGTQEYTGDGGNNFGRSQLYLDLMAQNKVSWVNWNYSDDERSGAVFNEGTCNSGGYSGTANLKPAGAWIRDRIRTADDF